MKKGDKQPPENTDEHKTRDITFEEFQNAAGNGLRNSQQAIWDKKAKSKILKVNLTK